MPSPRRTIHRSQISHSSGRIGSEAGDRTRVPHRSAVWSGAWTPWPVSRGSVSIRSTVRGVPTGSWRLACEWLRELHRAVPLL